MCPCGPWGWPGACRPRVGDPWCVFSHASIAKEEPSTLHAQPQHDPWCQEHLLFDSPQNEDTTGAWGPGEAMGGCGSSQLLGQCTTGLSMNLEPKRWTLNPKPNPNPEVSNSRRDVAWQLSEIILYRSIIDVINGLLIWSAEITLTTDPIMQRNNCLDDR